MSSTGAAQPIATFRRRNFQAVAESFLQVLLLARELKLLKLGVVSVDGSKLDANASKHWQAARRSFPIFRAWSLPFRARFALVSWG